jgi:FixJ family two-component response regulator
MNSASISLGPRMGSTHLFSPALGASVMADVTPIVFAVDEDGAVRESLELLIRRERWRCETFATAEEFLRRSPAGAPNCLVINVPLPDANALDLQKRVASERPGTSIIFIVARIDLATTVEAMKAGAIGIFMKPLTGKALVTSIQEALERSRINLAHEDEMRALRDRYHGLSRREQEVMALVVSGLLNKQGGGELGISVRTVKARRGQVMQKMKANSLANLVRMAEKLGRTLTSKEDSAAKRPWFAAVLTTSGFQLPL